MSLWRSLQPGVSLVWAGLETPPRKNVLSSHFLLPLWGSSWSSLSRRFMTFCHWFEHLYSLFIIYVQKYSMIVLKNTPFPHKIYSICWKTSSLKQPFREIMNLLIKGSAATWMAHYPRWINQNLMLMAWPEIMEHTTFWLQPKDSEITFLSCSTLEKKRIFQTNCHLSWLKPSFIPRSKSIKLLLCNHTILFPLDQA